MMVLQSPVTTRGLLAWPALTSGLFLLQSSVVSRSVSMKASRLLASVIPSSRHASRPVLNFAWTWFVMASLMILFSKLLMRVLIHVGRLVKSPNSPTVCAEGPQAWTRGLCSMRSTNLLLLLTANQLRDLGGNTHRFA